jgi:hypothetical protein
MPARPRRPRLLAIPLLLAAVTAVVVVVAACNAVPTSPTKEPGGPVAAPSSGDASPAPEDATMSPVSPAAVASVRAVIDGAKLAHPASIDALATHRFDDGAPEAAAAALSEGVMGDARWAAAWVYASAGTDPAVLRPLLADDDLSVRAVAAAAMTAWGDAAGLTVLASLAASDRPLAGSFPPETISDFAIGTLERFVAGGPASAADTGPAAAAAAWTGWLTGAGASLAFDQASGTWSAS